MNIDRGGIERQSAAPVGGVERVRSLVDLFAGCGGLGLGLEQAGFTPVFVNELAPDALQTYLQNRHHALGGEQFSDLTELHCRDVNDLDASSISRLLDVLKNVSEIDVGPGHDQRGIDLVAGGPPCQGFSGIGIRRSYALDRVNIPSNHLYEKMAFVVERVRPRIFLFENVRGILSARWTQDGSRVWTDVVEAFSLPGYTVRWSAVQAKDYGVPQRRPRVLMVGIRNDILADLERKGLVDGGAGSAADDTARLCGFLPESGNAKPPHLEDLLGDLVDPSVEDALLSGKYPSGRFETSSYIGAAPAEIDARYRRTRDGRPVVELTEQEYSKHRRPVVAKFRHMLKNHGEIPKEYRTKKFAQRLLKARWDSDGPNITATSLPDDYVHFSQPRVPTVREWARLQGFPDWYRFSGKRTTGGLRRAGNPTEGNFDRELPKYTQIGNAVPVLLAEAVGVHLRRLLDAVD